MFSAVEKHQKKKRQRASIRYYSGAPTASSSRASSCRRTGSLEKGADVGEFVEDPDDGEGDNNLNGASGSAANDAETGLLRKGKSWCNTSCLCCKRQNVCYYFFKNIKMHYRMR